MAMRKKTIFLIAILAIFVILTGLVCVGLVQAEDRHDAIYADYAALCGAIDGTRLCVTEQGNLIGNYALSQIHVRAETLEAAIAPYSALDRMEPEAFARLSIRTRLNYMRAEQPRVQQMSLELAECDFATVFDDLLSRRRDVAQDAAVVFADGAFVVTPEQPGTELDEEALRTAMYEALAETQIPADAAVEISVEVENYYLPPEITEETIKFDPKAELSAAISGKTLEVAIFGQSRGLSEAAIAGLLSVDASGVLKVDRAALETTVAQWAQACDQSYVPYRYTPYSGELQELEFLCVDYRVDRAALTDALENALLGLDFTAVEAPEQCFKNEELFNELNKTYVEVDIDSQSMSYYLDGKCIVHTSVVTGALDGHQTPTGFYHVENKDTDCWLSGEDYLVFVKYWVGIYGAYGIHDSSWRENYGGDFYVNGGSHGCVNTPESAMKTIFDNIEVGTPVVVFGKNRWYQPNV